MSKHTPGPWEFSGSTGGVFSQRKLVASVYGDDPDCKPDDRLKANARRIVACVNACEGIDDNNAIFLKGNSVRKVIVAMEIKRQRIEDQRDELLEALRVCATQSIGPDWTPEQALAFIKQHARAAIAKATGEQA